jgi:hypothetical protein
MQELTDEKRKELDKKVENGGDENIKIRTSFTSAEVFLSS